MLSRVQLLVTTWTAAYQAPPSMGFSRQEYWSGVPSPSPCVVSQVGAINLQEYPDLVREPFCTVACLRYMYNKVADSTRW